MKNKLLALISLVLVSLPAYLIAQDEVPVKFGKVTAADFVLPASAIIDSNVHAVIIADIGNAKFVGNDDGWLSYVFTRKTRIKIINRSALDLANIKIDLRQTEKADRADKLSELLAVTYNLEDGKVVETSLSKKEVFDERLSKRHFQRKFTLPAVKEGSIIEYSYKITSYFFYRMPEWEFQNTQYPCLWSEYKITVPSLLGYTTIRQGIHSFYIDKINEGKESYQIRQANGNSYGSGAAEISVSANTVSHRWVMKEAPAFNIENYISAASNYIDKVGFQLVQIYNGESTHEYYNTWTKAVETLLKDDEFGATLNDKNGWMDKIIDEILQGETDQLLQAKKIYHYISRNFTCTNYYNPYLTTSLYNTATKKTGSVGDINLLLVAMLRKKNIVANPVLFSTKDYGFSDPKYPLIDKLNYVTCRITVSGIPYNLDASHSFLSFGRLPANCYNGYARVISNTDSTMLYLNPDSLKEQKRILVTIANDEKNSTGFLGHYQASMGFFESNNIRAAVLKKGEKDYFSNIKSGFTSEVELKDAHIDSLQSLSEKLMVEYNFNLKADFTNDIIYFTPAMFFESFRENPFKTADRKYPVEMDYPVDETFVLSMEIPAGYDVEELPKSTKVLYNENEGYFVYEIQKSGNLIQFRCSVKMVKAAFSASEYNSLREFYTYVVKKQSEQIVFRRRTNKL